MALDDHSGYLGFTSRGVIAIHANWPNYPLEHGPQIVLTGLGIFPFGSTFEVVSDIDKCALLLATDYVADKRDLLSDANFHVALWHEDLLEASESGWIEGLERLTEREYRERERDQLRKELLALRPSTLVESDWDPLDHLGYMNEGGEFIRITLPPLHQYEGDDGDDFDPPSRDWLGTVEGSPIRLTRAGLNHLEESWSSVLEIPEVARPRIEPLIGLQQYDTALREIGVLLEVRMRSLVGDETSLYGARLGQAYLDKLVASGRYLPASLKTLRGELRTVLKFIRNRFAHNAVELSRPQALALISRTCHLLDEIDELTASASEPE